MNSAIAINKSISNNLMYLLRTKSPFVYTDQLLTLVVHINYVISKEGLIRIYNKSKKV